MTQRNDSGLSLHWERFSIWIAGLLLAVCAWQWTQQNDRINQMETKIQALQVDKVGRQELRDMEDRMYKQMGSMKTDIIDKLDWYFAGRRSTKENQK